MIDNKFTEEIARWLESDHSQPEQVEAGATLLLRLNRDTLMYQRITRRPQRELSFLEYKLRRYLGIRRDGQTINDVVKLDKEITPDIQAAIDSEFSDGQADVCSDLSDGLSDTLPVEVPEENDHEAVAYIRKGIRPDHDKLPANIQAIWTANAERWKKIKEAFNTCKTLTEPCDRYEYLKVLKDTWYKYKREMARYDDFLLTDSNNAENPVLTPQQEQEINNADSYISKNMPQMLQLAAVSKVDEFNGEQIEALENLRQRIQQRVDVLLRYGRTFSDERREQLISCGIRATIQTPGGNEQGQESE